MVEYANFFYEKANWYLSAGAKAIFKKEIDTETVQELPKIQVELAREYTKIAFGPKEVL